MKNAVLQTLRYLIGNIKIASIFVLSFIIAAFFIHIYIGNPQQLYADGRAEKNKLMENFRGQVNVAVFGTSRIHEGFDPQMFDQEMAKAQYPIQSINLGIFGGSHTEQKFISHEYIRKFLPPENKKNCLVIFELNAGINFPPNNLFHPRAVNIYDLDMIRFVYEYSDDSYNLRRKIGQMGFALIAGALHYSNAGMLSSILFPVIDEKMFSDSKGFRITEAKVSETEKVENFFVVHDKKPKIKEGFFVAGFYNLLDESIRYSAAQKFTKNMRYAYVVTPSLDMWEDVYDYPSEIKGSDWVAPIFDMGNHEAYPQLYEKQYWRNTGHLNKKGAELFSRLLAQEVSAWLNKNPDAKECGE